MRLGLGLNLFKHRPILGGFDVDALAFIAAEEAAGATFSPTQITAINNLFLDFKGIGPNNSTTDFWTTDKLKRYWPLVGAIAAANAIDIRLNTGIWAGGWTHSSNGAKGNASNTTFDSGLAFTGEIGGDWGHGMYIDDFTTGEWFSGYIRYAPTRISAMRTFFPNGGYYVRSSAVTYVGDTFTGARSTMRIGGDVEIVADSTFITSGTSADDGDDAFTFLFGAIRNDSFGGFGWVDSEYRSMYITYGITRAEAIILHNIDNAFQTALGRNTY